MLVIGVTGGSGSGKTTVSQAFEKLGGKSIDADAVYHELLENCIAMRREIIERFPEAGCEKNKVDRRALAKTVFSDSRALRDLNRITHPYVVREIERRIGDCYRNNLPIALIDAVGLFESGIDQLCDATVGVIAPRNLRIQRIMERDNLDEERAGARIDAQPGSEYYRTKCQHIIDTGSGRSADELAGEIYDKIMEGMEIEDE